MSKLRKAVAALLILAISIPIFVSADAAKTISFRDIPWYSTLAEAESIIGQTSKYRYAGDLRRLSYTNSPSISFGSDRVDGDLGCTISYSGLSVAGYEPSSTKICYIFPIVKGDIVRDFDLAQVYMAYYEFEDDDFGDLGKIYDDLKNKLNSLYGSGSSTGNNYYNYTFWLDQNGNKIRLQVNTSQTYLTLAYVASTADERLDEMAIAYANEQLAKEEATRQENSNNTDGL